MCWYIARGQGGFSLIELLAAMTLLCIGLLALFSCLGTSIMANAYAAQRADAVRVAQEQMEAVKGMCFDRVVSKAEQVERNGVAYTCQIVVQERSNLKDVAITVSWKYRQVSGDAAEQVQLSTALLNR